MFEGNTWGLDGFPSKQFLPRASESSLLRQAATDAEPTRTPKAPLAAELSNIYSTSSCEKDVPYSFIREPAPFITREIVSLKQNVSCYNHEVRPFVPQP